MDTGTTTGGYPDFPRGPDDKPLISLPRWRTYGTCVTGPYPSLDPPVYPVRVEPNRDVRRVSPHLKLSRVQLPT